MGKGKEQHVARSNWNTDFVVDGVIHQDAEVSTTTK
jgi:hypothetical protein